MEISAVEYEERVAAEVDKYFSTDNPQSGPDLGNLTFAEQTDVVDLDNTYSYLTAASISGKSGNLDLLYKGDALWNASNYQNLYTEGLSATENPGLTPPQLEAGFEKSMDDLSILGVTITSKPTLTPENPDVSVSSYRDPKNVLGENTKFVNENIFSFEAFPSLPEVEKQEINTVLVSIVDTLAATESLTSFNSLSVVSSDFDFKSPENTMDLNLRNPGPANSRTIFGMPPQFKSLMLGRSKSTRKNWLDAPVDPFTDPKTAGMTQFNYFEVQEIQVMVQYNDNRKKPSYTKLTKGMIDKIKQNGGSLFCRMVKYDNSKIVPNANRNLNYRRKDEYFIIKSGTEAAQVSNTNQNLTPFGLQLMKRLISSSENLQSFSQLQEQAEQAAEAATDAASEAVSSALDALSSFY